MKTTNELLIDDTCPYYFQKNTKGRFCVIPQIPGGLIVTQLTS